MEKFLQTLEPLVEQGKAKGFVNNVENADKLGSLVEDIRDAVMEYQVYICELTIFDTHLTFAPDFVTTRPLRKQLPAHSKSHPLSSHKSCIVTRG